MKTSLLAAMCLLPLACANTTTRQDELDAWRGLPIGASAVYRVKVSDGFAMTESTLVKKRARHDLLLVEDDSGAVREEPIEVITLARYRRVTTGSMNGIDYIELVAQQSNSRSLEGDRIRLPVGITLVGGLLWRKNAHLRLEPVLPFATKGKRVDTAEFTFVRNRGDKIEMGRMLLDGNVPGFVARETFVTPEQHGSEQGVEVTVEFVGVR